MSEAAVVLIIIGFVVLTLNVGIICQTAERIAEIKYKEDHEKELKDLEKKLNASRIGIIHNE